MQFSVDHSIRGTAKCKHCKKKIEKNILRIGKLEQFKKKEIVRYAHVDCSLKSLRKADQQACYTILETNNSCVQFNAHAQFVNAMIPELFMP